MARKIMLAEIVKDIQMGLGDVPIMEKYNIRPVQYIDILERLKGAQAVDERYLAGRIGREEQMKSDEEPRKAPRCYLVANVRIVDLLDSSVCGEVMDLTDKGCQLRGIECKVGETKRFRVQAEGYPGDRMDCRFAAQCRWGNWDQTEGTYVAGFEIKDITAQDRKNLRAIVRLLSICDE